MADVAAGAAVEPAQVLVVPERGGDVGEDKAEPRPEEDDGEAVDALCEEEVDEKAEAQADPGVEGHWPFFEKVVEDGALPETDEGTSYADVVGRDGIDYQTQGEA
jgi:hypothetical protein